MSFPYDFIAAWATVQWVATAARRCSNYDILDAPKALRPDGNRLILRLFALLSMVASLFVIASLVQTTGWGGAVAITVVAFVCSMVLEFVAVQLTSRLLNVPPIQIQIYLGVASPILVPVLLFLTFRMRPSVG